MDSHVLIAIDGPAASGKSTVARSLARRLGYRYVNTGAMYRAVTWVAVSRGVAPGDVEAVKSLMESVKIQCRFQDDEAVIFIDDVDHAAQLNGKSVADAVSAFARIPRVRNILVARQRACAKGHNVVMEGRDIGSIVFPDTPYKFYIDASLEVRAARRAKQGIADAIAARDAQDSSRATSPLSIAEDAHVIDSSHLTIDGVVGEIIGRLKLKGLALPEGA